MLRQNKLRSSAPASELAGEPKRHKLPLPGVGGGVIVRAAPVESFTVVMATGIVAVAARDNGELLTAFAFAALAGGGLALLTIWVAVARVRARRGVARGRNPVDRTVGLFGFVAAADVVAAQFDPSTSFPRMFLLVVALTAWVTVVTRLVTVLRATGLGALRSRARGSWLLAVVATQSLVLVAPRQAAAGGAAVLFLATLVAWTASLLGYLVIVAAVVRRLLCSRLAPVLLTPDMWILMGAQAITVVAGVTLVEDPNSAGGSGPLHDFAIMTVTACWLMATAWIPLLVTAEAWRACTRWPGFEISRWATVFPLGMYAVACSAVATIAPAIRTALHVASTVMFWIALAAWCATAAAMIVDIRRSARHARRPGPPTSLEGSARPGHAR